jgi:hypothetical protein
MKNVALELNKLYKIDISSFTRAAYQFLDMGIDDQYRLESFMLDVLGDVVPCKNEVEMQKFVGYVVQEAVRNHIQNEPTDPVTVIKAAKQKTEQYFIKNPWTQPKAVAVAAHVDTSFIPDRKHRAPRGSGMSKKERSVALYKQHADKSRQELIRIFVEELGLTPPGASTYVHNCKSGLWK